MDLYIAIFALIMTSSIPIVASVTTKNLTIESSGTIAYLQSRPLHVEGRYIKDDLGNVVYLRGVGQQPQWVDSEYGRWLTKEGTNKRNFNWDKTMVTDVLNAIKSWGANTIRWHTVIEHWKDEVKYPGYRQRIKDVITWAGERGLYIVFDFYSVVADGEVGHQQDKLPWPPYTSRSDVMPNPDAFVDLWISVANELKVFPNVLFELYNEPAGPKEEWFPIVQKLVNAIRATGAQNLIIIQYGYDIHYNFDTGYKYGMEWINDLLTNYPFNLTNVVWSTHAYRTYNAFGAWADGRKAYLYDDIKETFRQTNIYWVVETLNMPLFIGEFGVDYWQTGDDFRQELEALRNGLKIFNELGLHYTQTWFRNDGRWRLIDSGVNYPPNEAGQILKDAIASG